MAIVVGPVQRYQKVGDKTSSQLCYPKRKVNSSRLYDTKRTTQEIGELGGMPVEDIEHVVTTLVRNIKCKLAGDDSVKLDGLGMFYTTFHNKGAASSEECTVRNIDKVNIRFLTDNDLRLVNDSGAATKGSPNNVVFSLYNPKEDGPSGDDDNGSSDGGEEQDPLG